jgi:hypothetical protein
MTDASTPTTRTHRHLADLPFALIVMRHIAAAATGIGKAFAAGLVAYGRALALVYSAPSTRPPQKRLVMPAEDLQGRDPNW